MRIRRTCVFAGLLFLLFVLSAVIIAPPAYSGDYQKCVDAKGKIYLSNIGCPSVSEKTETYRLNDTTEREYQETERKNEEAKHSEEARQQANAQVERAREKERLLNQCLTEADERYQNRWDETCLFGGGAKGCALNVRISDDYDRRHQGERNECYLRYR
jgi:hypothetical protein